jgi:uncharacterized membrane protein
VIEPIAEAPRPDRSSRRKQFRAAVADLSDRSSSNDLIRWMLVPGSVAVLLGFVVMTLGWVGASHTARQIEQIPYLISGGLIGLALVVLGGILLAATFSAAVLRKVQEEADTRAAAHTTDLADRIAALEQGTPTRRPRRAG